MKNVILILCFIVLQTGFAQKMVEYQQIQKPGLDQSIQYTAPKVKQQNRKLYGDTLWYEDFDGGLPSCWSIGNNQPNSFQWSWDTVYRAGQNSLNTPAINSTTSANGFMSLTMDLFNTPFPQTGAVGMNTYFQSCAIPITPKPTVELRLQQFARFCCSGANDVVVWVSTDNFLTHTEFSLNQHLINSATPNVEHIKLDVSSVLAGQNTAYLRFYVNGMSHYYWMLDDVALVEGKGQALSSSEMNMGTTSLNGLSRDLPLISPLGYIQDASFSTEVSSVSNAPITGGNLTISVEHLSGVNGNPGQGIVWQQSALVQGSGNLSPFNTYPVSINTPPFTPLVKGDYEVLFSAISVQHPVPVVDQLYFSVGDSVFGKDFGTATGITGPSRYVFSGQLGGNPGDRFGLRYALDSSTTNIEFSSVSFYVSSDTNNIGAVIRPVVWEFSITGTSIVSNEVASSLSTFVINSSHLDSWQTFSLDTGIAMTRNNNVGQFVVGWELLSGTPSGRSLTVGSDENARLYSAPVSCFVSFAHNSPPAWGWVSSLPMIRLNVKQSTVGSEELLLEVGKLSVYPNPSNGVFQVGTNQKISLLRLYDMAGRKILEQDGSQDLQLDLSSHSNGVYFVEVQTVTGEVMSQKLIKH